MSNDKVPYTVFRYALPLVLLCALTGLDARASDLLLQASDLLALRPPARELVETGLLNPQQESQLKAIDSMDTDSHQDALRACEALRADMTAPHSARRWATFSQIHHHTLARMPMDDIVPIADKWMIENPDDYENNLHLRCSLANTYVYSAGSSGSERKQLLEHLMEPLLSDSRCTVSTIKAGLLYAALLQRCHTRMHIEWTSENIERYPTESRTLALEQQKVAYHEAERALLMRVDALLVALEEQPWRIQKYYYLPKVVESELLQQRRMLDSEIEGRVRALAGTKKTVSALERQPNPP